MKTQAVALVAFAAALVCALPVMGQGDADALTAKPVTADAKITAVTVYAGRAAITRSTTLTLDQGMYTVRFADLPSTVQKETLQARLGDNARLINVEYIEKPVADPTGSPAALALVKEIEAASLAHERLEQDRAEIAGMLKLVDQIGVRATSDASRDGGSTRLDIDALRKQLEFVQSERARLMKADRELADRIRKQEESIEALSGRLEAMGEVERIERTAEVTVAAPSGGQVPISLTYLVTNAGWEAIYSVRGAPDRSSVSVEFDANLAQQSGEDWKDVTMTISTAQPTVRANPPTVSPIYVTVSAPPRAPVEGTTGAPERRRMDGRPMAPASEGFGYGGGGSGGGSPIGSPGEPSEEDLLRERLGAELRHLSSGAAVAEGGTAVSYRLPRTVSVPTDADRMTRERVATITPAATWVYTAAPLLTDAVYLRSKLVNGSPYQLIPGKAQVFMGPEYVGPTSIGSVAPNGEFDVYFGIDRSIRATRALVSKNTTESGVFTKSREVTRNYRIMIDNGSGRAIDLELFDRRPVSQNEKVTVTTDALAVPLSTNAEYVRDQLPQGIMRWDLQIPATATGASAMAITWTTKISAPRDAELTPVPD